MTNLDRAKAEIDLGAFMREDGVKIKRAGTNEYTGFCPFHENHNTPAFSVSLREGRCWVYKCFNPTCDASGTIVDYLVERDGLSMRDACRKAEELLAGPRPARASNRVVPPKNVVTTSVSQAERANLARWQARITAGEGIALLKARGLSQAEAFELGLGVTDANCNYGAGHLVFPLYDVHGELAAIKCRITGAEEKKYRWITAGRGTPGWLSPNLAVARRVLLVEGEFNGMSAWLALKDQVGEPTAVVGIGSASNHVNQEHVRGRDVWIVGDDDDAGRKAMATWLEECTVAGARSVTPLGPLPEEPGDYSRMLAILGREALRSAIDSATSAADSVPVRAVESLKTASVDNGPSSFGLARLDTSARPRPTAWAVAKMVPRGKVASFASIGGVGKSSLMADLAVCVRHGQQFCGRETERMPVVYLDWEDDADALTAWVRRCERGRGVPVGSTDLLYVNVPSVPGIGHRPLHETVVELAASLTEPSLVIVDTFEAAMQIDSNKASNALIAMRALKRLASLGHTVVVLDHLPKLGKGQTVDSLTPTGSVQKTNQARAVFRIEDVTPPGWSSNVLKFSCVKLNGARRPEPFAVERRVDSEAEIATFTECDVPSRELTEASGPKTAKARALALETLRSGASTQARILALCEADGVGERTARAALSVLVEEGLVLRSGGQGRGDEVRYGLNDLQVEQFVRSAVAALPPSL